MHLLSPVHLLCLLCGQCPLSLASLLLISSHSDRDRGGRAEHSLPAKLPSHAPRLVPLAPVRGHCLINSWLSAVLFQKLGALVSAPCRGPALMGPLPARQAPQGRSSAKRSLEQPGRIILEGVRVGGERNPSATFYKGWRKEAVPPCIGHAPTCAATGSP